MRIDKGGRLGLAAFFHGRFQQHLQAIASEARAPASHRARLAVKT